MARPAPANRADDLRITVDQYVDLVTNGVLDPDDRVELLEGVVVAMSPQNPRHAVVVHRAWLALQGAVGDRATVRSQSPFRAGRYSMPEPDLAVVPGVPETYMDAHPTAAHLVVEVAETSLPQDRLTKATIYAAAGIPEYWIVDLRKSRVHVYRLAQPRQRRYPPPIMAGRGEWLEIAALPGVRVAVDDVLPPPRV